MRRSKAFEETGKGIVYLVSTPIGNLEDITYRAVRILKESDIVACEDTRNTALLLKHYDIRPKRLVSLYSQIEERESAKLVREVRQKNLTLSFCSDAGMPGISDPGALLCKACKELDVPVTVLPGPSAALTGLLLSGLDTADFSFFGFLPPKETAKKTFLKGLKDRPETLLFYESPKRVGKTLQDMKDIFSADRKVALIRELTKIHEETIEGTLGELCDIGEVKGEIVLVVDGMHGKKETDEEDVDKAIKALLKEQKGAKEISAILAERFGMKKGEAYQRVLALK